MDGESLFNKINPKWQARINRCVDITRIIANKSPENNEALFEQLKDSIYAHTQSRLEAFIFVCTNVCFVWPHCIPQLIRIYNFLIQSETNENILGKTKYLIYKQLLHWYFSDKSDDVFIFILQIFLQCIEYQIFEVSELVSKIKKRFIQKSIFHDQLCLMVLFFSPEIEEVDPSFLEKTQNYIQQCLNQHVLSPKIYLILLDYDKFRNNNWEYLKQSRKFLPEVGFDLFKAIYNDDVDKFIELIEKERSTNPSTDSILNGYIENPTFSVFGLIDIDTPYINAAALFGSEKIFKYLYESGVSLHSVCKNGATIDQCACINPKSAIISILEKENVNFEFALSSFSRCFDFEAVNDYMYLISKSKTDVTRTGSTAINLSIMCCNFLIFRVCLEKNSDIDLEDGFGMKPLDYACQFGNVVFYKSLLYSGADVTKASPVYYAAKYGNSTVLTKLLKNSSIDPDIFDQKRDRTPLKEAIMNSHYGVVKKLLNDDRIDLSRRFKNDLCYVNFAASQNDIRIFKLIFDKVAVKIPDLTVSPLFNSIFFNCVQMTEYLLFHVDGIDPNKLTKNQDVNALWLSVKRGNYEITEMILDNKINKLSPNEVVQAQTNNDSKMMDIIAKYDLSLP